MRLRIVRRLPDHAFKVGDPRLVIAVGDRIHAAAIKNGQAFRGAAPAWSG